jgi:DtxR family Mn-dependent transcriptional regulator
MIQITQTQEDYLRAIYLLSNKGQLEVKSSDVVEKLGLSKSTVTQRLQDLALKGWITQQKYGPVTITPLGIKIGGNLTFKHRIIELFLTKNLGIAVEDVHTEAHKLEHAMSDDVILRLADFLGNPTHGPHGEEMPKFEA